MNYTIKTGLILSTVLLLLALISMQYDLIGTQTVIDVFIAVALIINASLLIKVFKDKK